MFRNEPCEAVMVSPVRNEQCQVYVSDTLCPGEKHSLGNMESKELLPITNMGTGDSW